jgi:hypothetical protein
MRSPNTSAKQLADTCTISPGSGHAKQPTGINALKSINRVGKRRRLHLRGSAIEAAHMDRILIRGGNRLSGTIAISGAKNSALTLMPCALLTDEPLT